MVCELAGSSFISVVCTTEVYLLRFWEAEPLTQAPTPAEECKQRLPANILLMDVHNTFMKASVKVHRLNTFKHFFKACSIYGVSRFDVTPSNLNSKLSNSPPSIRFSDLTDFTEITEPVSPVPQELFQFRDYEQLQHIFQRYIELEGRKIKPGANLLGIGGSDSNRT
ncbi:hypothetical protein HID58_080075, partial [Brassica napus]